MTPKVATRRHYPRAEKRKNVLENFEYTGDLHSAMDEIDFYGSPMRK